VKYIYRIKHDPAQARRYGYRDARSGLPPVARIPCECHCPECLDWYEGGYNKRKAYELAKTGGANPPKA